jgi:hypothetical protein
MCNEPYLNRDRNFSVAVRFRFIQVLESLDPRDCSLKTGFRYVQVPFNTGVIVLKSNVDNSSLGTSTFCFSPSFKALLNLNLRLYLFKDGSFWHMLVSMYMGYPF